MIQNGPKQSQAWDWVAMIGGFSSVNHNSTPMASDYPRQPHYELCRRQRPAWVPGQGLKGPSEFEGVEVSILGTLLVELTKSLSRSLAS